jgi:hypothetical protein
MASRVPIADAALYQSPVMNAMTIATQRDVSTFGLSSAGAILARDANLGAAIVGRITIANAALYESPVMNALTIAGQRSASTFALSSVGAIATRDSIFGATIGSGWRPPDAFTVGFREAAYGDLPAYVRNVASAPSIAYSSESTLVDLRTQASDVAAILFEEEVDRELAARLASIDSDYVEAYRGAVMAFVRQDFDHVRHTAISLRELVSFLLHELGSDALVLAYSAHPSDYDRGRPTRRGRLRALNCRAVSCGSPPLTETEIQLILDTIKDLSSLTHKRVVRVPNTALRRIMRNAVASVDMMMTVAGY